MTETRFTWRWLFVVGGIGIAAGLLLGLLIGWVLAPAAASAVNVSALNAGAQNDYIVMVANSFAFDSDLPRAKERLALLKDTQVKTRVERLAKALSTRQDSNAANVADLAVALGSTDNSLQVLAASVANVAGAAPTKVARPEILATATLQPTTASTLAPTLAATTTPTTGPTLAPTKAVSLVVKSTPKPAPTNPPPAAPQAPTTFLPDFPGQWWNGIKFSPASVAAGQQYWHLTWALYCDVADQRNNCPGLAGGGMDHTIYVMVVNPDGSCANANVKHEINTGDTPPLDQKTVAYAWNQYSCTTDYEWAMSGEGNDLWIDGMPSDRIDGLCMCNVIPPPGSNGVLQGHAHVRYFIIFQLTTR